MNSLSLPAATLLLGLLPDLAAACTCLQPPPIAERRLMHHSAFHGRVIESGLDEPGQRRWIRFQVIKDYGVMASGDDTLTVWTGIHSGVCGIEFPVGTEALVFANIGTYPTSQDTVLGTSSCSGNVSGAGLEQALLAMEETLSLHPWRSQYGIRREGARLQGGQVLFVGKVQANGVYLGDRESR